MSSQALSSRIGGIDVVRGVAVLGMFTAHVGYDADSGVAAWLWLADGRSAATFAILAGVSVALFTGRSTPPQPGHGLASARARILARAGILLVIGVILETLGTPVAVILPSYAVTFAVLTLAVRFRPAACALLAAAVAVVGPVISHGLDTGTFGPSWLAGPDNEVGQYLADLVFVGYYPMVVWLAYMLLGLAIGRLALTSARVQGMLALAGVAMLAAGYGTARLLASALTAPSSSLTRQLISAEPHADSTFELVGNAGVTLVLLAGALALTSWRVTARVAGVVLYPVAATGAMALTAYTVHIVAIAITGDWVVWETVDNGPLLWFIGVTLVATTLWRLTLGRGPLERLMRALTPPPWQPAAPLQSAAWQQTGPQHTSPQHTGQQPVDAPDQSSRGESTQNSLPSGSASTTHVDSSD